MQRSIFPNRTTGLSEDKRFKATVGVKLEDDPFQRLFDNHGIGTGHEMTRGHENATATNAEKEKRPRHPPCVLLM